MGIALAAVLAACWWSQPGHLLHLFELRSLDFRFHVRGDLPSPDDVAIVVIDERSLRDPDLGTWPWTHKRYEELVRLLAKDGASAVVFDILFTGAHDEATVGFAEACRETGIVYLASYASDHVAIVEPKMAERERFALLPRLTLNRHLAREFRTVEVPVPPLLRAIKGMGLIMIPPDPDGVFRRCYLAAYDGQTHLLLPSLAFSVALDRLRVSREQLEVDFARQICLDSVRSVPLDGRGRALINYSGGRGHYPTWSYADVYAGAAPEGCFRNKIVIVGFSAPGLYDIHPSPTSPEFLGAEVNAEIVSNLLHGSFLIPFGDTHSAILLVALGLAMSACAWYLEPRWGAVAGAALFGVFVAGVFVAFARHRLVVPLVGPCTAMVLGYLSITTYRLLGERTARQRLLDNFRRYAPAEVVMQLDESAVRAQLGGTQREITVLFADIQGFTPRVSEVHAHQVVNFLNSYFTELTELVFAYEGTVDNLMGDEIMVLFGALRDQPDHAKRAVALALAMLDVVSGSQGKWAEAGFPDLRVGIGVHTGPAVVGNVGSESRMHYTAIGATVNIASRLENLTRELGADVLVSAETYERCRDIVEVAEVGPVEVRGVPQPVTVFRVIGAKEQSRLQPS